MNNELYIMGLDSLECGLRDEYKKLEIERVELKEKYEDMGREMSLMSSKIGECKKERKYLNEHKDDVVTCPYWKICPSIRNEKDCSIVDSINRDKIEIDSENYFEVCIGEQWKQKKAKMGTADKLIIPLSQGGGVANGVGKCGITVKGILSASEIVKEVSSMLDVGKGKCEKVKTEEVSVFDMAKEISGRINGKYEKGDLEEVENKGIKMKIVSPSAEFHGEHRGNSDMDDRSCGIVSGSGPANINHTTGYRGY